MPTRTRAALGGLLAVLVLGAGCLGVVAGSEPLVAAASDARVAPAAVDATDFQAAETRSAWMNRTVEVAGESREVRVRNHVATYRLPPTLGDDGSVSFGAFSVVSTPQVAIAGQPLNPVGRLSHDQLVEQVSARADGVHDVRQVGSSEVTVLGSTAEVTRFSAVVERSGRELPVTVAVTRVEDGEDYVVAVGVYPEGATEVRAQVETLLAGIEH